jgi:hypothetical protein
MKVVVQHLESEQFLGANDAWVVSKADARSFKNSVEAITFCIERRMRLVRLIAGNEFDQRELFFYPFGGDPVAKAERKTLRKALAASRRLKEERRVIQRRVDALLAEAKETRKQFPFKRKEVDGDGRATA